MTEKSRGPLLAFSSDQLKEGSGEYLRNPKEKDLSKEVFKFAMIGTLGIYGSVACIAITFYIVNSTAHPCPGTWSLPDLRYLFGGLIVSAVAMLIMIGALICSVVSLVLLLSGWLAKAPLKRFHVVSTLLCPLFIVLLFLVCLNWRSITEFFIAY